MTFWPCLRIFWQLSRTILDGVHCFTVHCKFSEDLPWHCHSRSLSCYWGYNFGSPDFFQVNVTCPCQSSLALLSISTYVCRYLWFLQVYVTGFYSSFPSCFSCRRVGYKTIFLLLMSTHVLNEVVLFFAICWMGINRLKRRQSPCRQYLFMVSIQFYFFVSDLIGFLIQLITARTRTVKASSLVSSCSDIKNRSVNYVLFKNDHAWHMYTLN